MHVGDKRTRLVVNTTVSLPFQVKRDEAVYVGELKWTQSQREFVGLFSNRSFSPDPASFSISDRAARDVPAIRERYPTIAERPLRIEIPVGDRRLE